MDIEQWHQTPAWHWRYWVGFRMRRATDVSHFADPEWKWDYRTYGQHARTVLHRIAHQ